MAIKKELIQFTISNETDCSINLPLFQQNVYSVNATTKYSWDITSEVLACGTGTIVVNGNTLTINFAPTLAGLLSALNALGFGFFCTETIGGDTFLYVVDDTNVYGGLDLCPVETTTTTTTTTVAPETTTTTTTTTVAPETTTTTTTTTVAPETSTTTTTSTTTAPETSTTTTTSTTTAPETSTTTTTSTTTAPETSTTTTTSTTTAPETSTTTTTSTTTLVVYEYCLGYDVSSSLLACQDASNCTPTTTTTSTTSTTTEPETTTTTTTTTTATPECTIYLNETGNVLTGIDYTDCSQTQFLNVTVPIGGSLCVYLDIITGGDASLLTDTGTSCVP